MGVGSAFRLRSAAGSSALRGGDTIRGYPPGTGWVLTVGGIDLTSLVDLRTIRVRLSGGPATGTLDAEVEDLTRAHPLPGGADVALLHYDESTIGVFGGNLVRRSGAQLYGLAARTTISAADYGRLLDQSIVTPTSLSAGMTDREAIQSLVATYGHAPLRAPDATVDLTATSLPAIGFAAPVTLRAAIEQVASLAGTGRSYYVDEMARLVYVRDAVIRAPYEVSDAPTGAQIGAEEISVEYDDSGIINAVYVQGPDVGGVSGWVIDQTSIDAYGRREAILANSDSTTTAKRDLYGSAYLAKVKDPTIRGRVVVTGYDGWRVGQILTLTSAAHGLSAAQYVIREIAVTIHVGTGVRTYEISFGEPPKSLIRQLAATA